MNFNCPKFYEGRKSDYFRNSCIRCGRTKEAHEPPKPIDRIKEWIPKKEEKK